MQTAQRRANRFETEIAADRGTTTGFLRILLLGDPDVVREAHWRAAGLLIATGRPTGRRLREILETFRPRWILCDEELTESKIHELMAEAERLEESTSFALLGASTDFARCERWIRLGARCYLASSHPDDQVMLAIKFAETHGVLVVDGCFQRHFVERGHRLRPSEPLTERELQMLRLARDGLRTDQIAAALHLTSHTVDFHFRNVMDKFGVRGRTQAVVRAIIAGLIGTADTYST